MFAPNHPSRAPHSKQRRPSRSPSHKSEITTISFQLRPDITMLSSVISQSNTSTSTVASMSPSSKTTLVRRITSEEQIARSEIICQHQTEQPLIDRTIVLNTQKETKTETESASNNEAFPLKLRQMLIDVANESREDIISWQPDGLSFKIFKPKELEELILPRYFKHGKYRSFQRQVSKLSN